MTRLAAATRGLSAPLAALDLTAFDANAGDLARRAGGLPIRVASKSLRCRDALTRVLALPGYAGVMAYALAEALWLVGHGIDDVFVAYPSVDRAALAALLRDDRARAEVTITIDSVEHVDLLADALGRGSRVRVAIDVDCSVRLGRLHLGVRRSPVRTPSDAVTVARAAQAAGLSVVGALFYDAQVAGLPDASAAVRWLKRRTVAELPERRAAVVEALRGVANLAFVNGGGTGSLHTFTGDASVTELAAGSGLYGPTLFDGYRSFHPEPALQVGLPAVRRPAPGVVTLFSGGYVASGEPGWSRVPHPVDRALALLRTEGAGEVQTPVRGASADRVALGDTVWFRGAKAGELLERFDTVHVVEGDAVVATWPTYRGEGRNFG